MKRYYSMFLLCISICIGCKRNQIGKTTVDVSKTNSEILVDNFPHGTYGIEGMNTISYPEGFSHQKIDELIYKYLKNESFNYDDVKIKVRYVGTDQYGKDTVGKWIMVGAISESESKKYEDFHLWKRSYGISNLLDKLKTSENTSVNNQQDEPIEHHFTKKTEAEWAAIQLSAFEPEKGENTTIYNQSDYNLKKLQWREIEDVFFLDHVREYLKNSTVEGFEGTVISYNPGSQYDIISINDFTFGEIDLYFHSLSSSKSIARPIMEINIGDNIEAWGARVEYEGKTFYYLNQAILKPKLL